MKKSNYNNISIYIILNALFLFAFTQFLLINVYPTLMNEFNINSSQIQLLTTLFLFTTLLLIPFSSFISNRFQSNTLINVSLAFLIIGTIIGSQSYDFYLLLFSRIIQGIGFAIILPISQTVILNISNNNNQAMYLGILNSVINIGPAIAPPVTGIFIEYFEWRSLYYIMLPLEFILFILSLLFLKNNFTKKRDYFNIKSSLLYLVLCTSIFLILLFLNSHYISTLASFVFCSLSVITYINFEKKQIHPLINLKFFRNKVTILSISAIFLTMLLLLSVESILPILTQSVFKFSPMESGFIMTPGTIILIVATTISGNLFDKYQSSNIMMFGIFTILLSLSLFLSIHIETSLLYLIFLFCLFMFGMGFVITPITTLSYSTFSRNKLNQAAALINTFRQLGLVLGVTLFAKLVSIISAFNFSSYDTFNLLIGIKGSFILMCLCTLIILYCILRIKLNL